VVPFAPGGITDVIGRALGQRLAQAWSQQVVIDPTGLLLAFAASL
jgi:tripartite-type tricarboxylate transporter receptor subunit TctC